MATIQKTLPNGQIANFDETWTEEEINEYMQLPKHQPIKNQDKINNNKERGWFADVGMSAVDGVRDGVQSTIGLLEGLGDTLGEKTNIGGFVFGEDAENGVMGYENYEQWKAKGREDLLFGKAGVKDAIELPDFKDDPQTMAGGVVKGVSQFLTGWFTGGKVLKGVKYASGGYKGISPFLRAGTTGQVTKTMTQGAIADFTAFDEETGRLVDMVNEYAPSLQNPIFEYLASDPDDTFWEARFKNALEGAGIGGTLETTFRTFRYIKNTNKNRNKEKFNKKQLEEDEKSLQNLSEKDVIQSDLRPIREKVGSKVIKTLSEEDISDSAFKSFKEAQKLRNKGEFDKALENLDLSLNFNARSFIELDKQGLLGLKAFNKVYKDLVDKKKIVLTDEKVQAMAHKLYANKTGKLEVDLVELDNIIKTQPYKIVAMNSYIETVSSLAKRLANVSQKNGDPLIRRFLLEKILPKWEQITLLKESISESTARSLRLMGKSTDESIAGDLSKVMKEDELYTGDPDKLIRQLAKAGDTDISKIISYVAKNKTFDVLNEVWINALLSNPKTHIINMSGNLMNMFIRPLERVVGSRMSSSLLENPAKVKKLQAEGMKALGSYSAMRRYMFDALRYSALAFKNEDTIISASAKLDVPKKAIQKTKFQANPKTGQMEEVLDNDSIGGIFTNYLGKFARVPTRFLNAEDEFFRQIGYRMNMERFAIDDALRLGKSKDKIVAVDVTTRKPMTEFDAHVLEQFNKGFDEYGRGINAEVMRKADELTYTQELDGFMKHVQSFANEYPILKQVIPFIRTPVNLMLNVTDRVGLGVFRRRWRDDFMGRNGAERMAQARGGLATGYTLITVASIMHREGMITGSQGQIKGEEAFTSKDLKDLRKQTGRLPYSFRYWSEEEGTYKYKQFGRFDPFGAFFGLVADFNEVYDKLTEQELRQIGGDMLILMAKQGNGMENMISPTSKMINTGKATFSSMSRNLVSKTYLKGLAEFIDMLTDDSPNKAEYWFRQKIGSYIPNIWAKFTNDPFYRDARSLVEEARNRSGIGDTSEFKFDFRGRPLKRSFDSEDKRLFDGLFNPIANTTQQDDPVAEEVIRLGVNMPKLNRMFEGTIDTSLFVNKEGQTLENRMYQMLRELSIQAPDGKYYSLDERLKREITTDLYKQKSDPIDIDGNQSDTGAKAKHLRSIVNDYHSEVLDLIKKEASKFVSTKDDSGTFTLLNAIQGNNNNKMKMEMGVPIKMSDIDGLYQWSK